MALRDVLIIMPAYNEAENIDSVMDSLDSPEIAAIADVLVMNDHSSDSTSAIVKEHHHAVVTHVFNLGYGSGLQLGYKYAIRRGYRYVVQMDADGQHDICNIPDIYRELTTPDENGKYLDIVIGSRYMEGSAPYRVSWVKELAYKLFRGMIRLGTGVRITDPTSGLQGLSRRAMLFYSQYDQFDDKYPDANIIMQMLLLGFRLKEIPAVMHNRGAGESMHSGLKPVIYMFRMFFSILSVYVRVRVFHWNRGAADENE